jgi:hypothetical protein
MIIGIFLTLASALAVTPTPAPTIQNSRPSVRPTRMLISYIPESARCGEIELGLADVSKTQIFLGWQNAITEPVLVQFRVDETGRPLGIKREVGSNARIGADDVTAALAASRFAAGKARFGCTIKFTPKATVIEEAALVDAFEYSIFPTSGSNQAVFDRLKPVASDCFNYRPEILLLAYPDFKKIAAAPGQFEWSMTQFDINGDGMPVAAQIIAGSGNRLLDEASVAAVRKSRFGDNAKTVCLYPYWRAPSKLAAPEIPANDAYRPVDADCPPDIKWATRDAATYPNRFNGRNIEGWATIVFDVAFSGGTGNVRIAASEPATEFGEAGAEVIKLRKVVNGGKAMTGCVERVRFIMDPDRPFGTQDSIRDGK